MFFQIIFVCVLLSYTSGQAPLNKDYKAETYFKANWFEAYQFCRDHKMQLATINSDAEQQALYQVLPPIESYDYGAYESLFWISGTDLAEDGNYKWFSTGKAMSYTSWDANYPIERYQSLADPVIDNIEDCVQFNGFNQRWITANCSTLNYFVCETV